MGLAAFLFLFTFLSVLDDSFSFLSVLSSCFLGHLKDICVLIPA